MPIHYASVQVTERVSAAACGPAGTVHQMNRGSQRSRDDPAGEGHGKKREGSTGVDVHTIIKGGAQPPEEQRRPIGRSIGSMEEGKERREREPKVDQPGIYGCAAHCGFQVCIRGCAPSAFASTGHAVLASAGCTRSVLGCVRVLSLHPRICAPRACNPRVCPLQQLNPRVCVPQLHPRSVQAPSQPRVCALTVCIHGVAPQLHPRVCVQSVFAAGGGTYIRDCALRPSSHHSGSSVLITGEGEGEEKKTAGKEWRHRLRVAAPDPRGWLRRCGPDHYTKGPRRDGG